MKFSIIIPVYNRPQEIQELLQSLLEQTYKNFEVLVIEDGSQQDAKTVVTSFQQKLDLQYFFISNGGQGFARNYGFQRASGDFFVVFDSDCLIPSDYLENVLDGLKTFHWDAYGGPDAAHPQFNAVQKAISYSMTSPLTTGGIRGQKKHIGPFYPRSFNMGISRSVWEQTGGFHWTNQSEDMEFSRRMHTQGFRVGLIPEAKVYHKRRTNFLQFFKQIQGFGAGRMRLARTFPDQLSWFHLFPAGFFLGNLSLIFLSCIWPTLFYIGLAILMIWVFAIFLHSWAKTRSFQVACLSVAAGFIQLNAYGYGFLRAFFS